jgi:hypothetical protein
VQAVDHWGGEKLDGLVSADVCSTCIPSQIRGWKRYLANEYLNYGGYYRSDSASTGSSRSGGPTTQPAAPTASAPSPPIRSRRPQDLLPLRLLRPRLQRRPSQLRSRRSLRNPANERTIGTDGEGQSRPKSRGVSTCST